MSIRALHQRGHLLLADAIGVGVSHNLCAQLVDNHVRQLETMNLSVPVPGVPLDVVLRISYQNAAGTKLIDLQFNPADQKPYLSTCTFTLVIAAKRADPADPLEIVRE